MSVNLTLLFDTRAATIAGPRWCRLPIPSRKSPSQRQACSLSSVAHDARPEASRAVRTACLRLGCAALQQRCFFRDKTPAFRTSVDSSHGATSRPPLRGLRTIVAFRRRSSVASVALPYDQRNEDGPATNVTGPCRSVPLPHAAVSRV